MQSILRQYSDCSRRMPLVARQSLAAIRQAVIDVGLAREQMSDVQWERWQWALGLLPEVSAAVEVPVVGAYADEIHDATHFR
jgi:hypothetical protein